MKIAFVGMGNMGVAVMCAALSKGLNAVAIDIDEEKVKETLKGKCVVPEANAEKILKKALDEKRLEATSDISVIKECDMTFIGVQTPVEGEICNYKVLERVVTSICYNAPKNHLVFCGSTVFPGSIDDHVLSILREQGRDDINFVYHPVFLRAGFGIDDYLNPGKVIIGVKDPNNPPNMMVEFIKRVINCPEVLKTASYYEAEWIKMVHNQFMCTKITFVNEIQILCQEYDVDAEKVIDFTFGETTKGRLLTQSHMKPGVPFSGPCLPKDVSYMRGLVKKSKSVDYIGDGILNAAKTSNDNYRNKIVNEVIKLTQEFKSPLGIIGVAFRSDFNEMRHSLSLDFIKAAHKNEILWMGHDGAFEDISEQDYKLACRQERYLESLYNQVKYSFKEVIESCKVLFINSQLTDEQIEIIKSNKNEYIDIYNNF